tara:strand:+ start:446 stop:1075 length:630 start_codon:yes stop_codon:yes gene_type:complete
VPSERAAELTDPNWRKVYGSTVVKGKWQDWILNAMDISHINTVHDFADETRGEVINMKITRPAADEIQAEAGVHPKASSPVTLPAQVRICPVTSRFIMPATSYIRIALKAPLEFVTYTTQTPVDENHSLMSWCFAWNFGAPLGVDSYLESKFKDEMLKTIEEDERILGDLLPYNLNEVNVPADAFQLRGLAALDAFLKLDRITNRKFNH